jgi:hypothetical protein
VDAEGLARIGEDVGWAACSLVMLMVTQLLSEVPSHRQSCQDEKLWFG